VALAFGPANTNDAAARVGEIGVVTGFGAVEPLVAPPTAGALGVADGPCFAFGVADGPRFAFGGIATCTNGTPGFAVDESVKYALHALLCGPR